MKWLVTLLNRDIRWFFRETVDWPHFSTFTEDRCGVLEFDYRTKRQRFLCVWPKPCPRHPKHDVWS